MELWCIFLLFLGVASGSSILLDSDDSGNNWRTGSDQLSFSPDDDPNAWRKQVNFKSLGVSAFNDEANNWRNQRSYSFPRFSEMPFIRLFNRKENSAGQQQDKETKIGKEQKGLTTQGVGEEEGVVGCAPGFGKCIPRLGR